MSLTPDELAEQEAWDDLLRCPGWLRLEQEIRATRTARLEADMERAANHPDDETVVRRIQAIAASRREVEGMLALPRERLATLKARSAQTRTDPELVFQRGGL